MDVILAGLAARAPYLSAGESVALWRTYKAAYDAVRVVPRRATGNYDETLFVDGLVAVAAFWHVRPDRCRSLVIGCRRAGGAR